MEIFGVFVFVFVIIGIPYLYFVVKPKTFVPETYACNACADTGRAPNPQVMALTTRQRTNAEEESCRCDAGLRLRKQLRQMDSDAFNEWKAQVRHEKMIKIDPQRVCFICGGSGIDPHPRINYGHTSRRPEITETDKCCRCLAGVRRRRRLRD